MPSDWVFVTLGLLSIATVYAISQANLRSYMKKKNFDLEIQAEKLKLQKLRKEMNLTTKKQNEPETPDTGLLGQLANLDIDKIQGLLKMVQKSDDLDYDEPEGEAGIMDTITNIANENPELVKQFIGKLKAGPEGESDQQYLGG